MQFSQKGREQIVENSEKKVGILKHNKGSICQTQKSQSERNAVISKNSEDLAKRIKTWVQ